MLCIVGNLNIVNVKHFFFIKLKHVYTANHQKNEKATYCVGEYICK